MSLKKCIVLIMILMAIPVVGSSFSSTNAKIVALKIGKDKAMSQETDSFGSNDTIFAAADIAGVSGTVTVKAQLLVEDIPGQQPGPIKGAETTLKMARSGRADFNFTKPNKGWPKGKYGIEVVALDEHGEQLDLKDAEFIVE